MGSWHIGRFYLHDIDAEVSDKRLKISGLWGTAGVLPDFEATPAPHVECQHGVAASGLPACIGQHELGLCRLFKYRDIETEVFPVPTPSGMNVTVANAYLLNTCNQWMYRCHFIYFLPSFSKKPAKLRFFLLFLEKAFDLATNCRILPSPSRIFVSFC
jgi:hypothetical protein